MHHPIRATKLLLLRQAAVAPKWPSYTGTSQHVGQSSDGRTTVYVDPSLGAPGLKNAQNLVGDADRIAVANDALFGTTGGLVDVIIYALGGATDGTGGADHMGCDYTNGAAIEVCASFGNSARLGAVRGRAERMLDGWQFVRRQHGRSAFTLVRADDRQQCAFRFRNGTAMGAGRHVELCRPHRSHRSEPGQHRLRMAFLSWLISRDYGLGKIAQAMAALGDAGTLAQLYANLSTNPSSGAWPQFQSAVQALPNAISTDDPFGKPG